MPRFLSCSMESELQGQAALGSSSQQEVSGQKAERRAYGRRFWVSLMLGFHISWLLQA
jgi:hypothetical protein